MTRPDVLRLLAVAAAATWLGGFHVGQFVADRRAQRHLQRVVTDMNRSQELARRLELIKRYESQGRDTTELERYLAETPLDSTILCYPPPPMKSEAASHAQPDSD